MLVAPLSIFSLLVAVLPGEHVACLFQDDRREDAEDDDGVYRLVILFVRLYVILLN